ncbi:hypothetical protein B0J12DRAFT_781953 [Macrophomina phaseolina]|uniref:Uncharacterized protein n=1 Tax=Macrophomina phaseolina TaxID=35725 RepID=A0ABQ8GU59_9PEZI|nr:hypothetical protein B0J12DRAFT_781953 [Macrophomina phaseolina]
MHVAAVVLFCLLAWARPSHQYPSRLQRTTGCRCLTLNSNETRAFWLQPPQLENPGDTCRRLGYQLGEWLQWIDGHTDLQTAWQLYDDILQNRRANSGVPLRKRLSQTAARGEPDARATGDAADDESKVSCQIEGMVEVREDSTLSDSVLVRVFLGAILLAVLYESASRIWWRLSRGLSKVFGVSSGAGEIRL